MNSNAEIIIRDNAKKHNIKNVIKTGQSGLDCYIKHIKKKQILLQSRFTNFKKAIFYCCK